MLQLQNIVLTHKKDLFVLVDHFSCQIQAGEKVAIIGEEGSGKSALLKYIYGDHELTSYLDLSGQVINGFESVGYLPQFLAEADLKKDIYEFIFADLDMNHLDYQRLAQLESQLSLTSGIIYSQERLETLSGGQKIKLQLLKLLLQDPDLLLLDEPSNDLDWQTLIWLETFIKTSDKTIIFISHDLRLLQETATAIIHLERLKHKSQSLVTFARMDYQTYLTKRSKDTAKQSQLASQQEAYDKKRMQELTQVKQKVHHQLAQTKASATGRLLAKKMKNLKSREKRFERERQIFVAKPIQEEKINMRWGEIVPLPATKKILTWTSRDLMVADRLLVSALDLSLYGQEKVGLVGQNGMGKSVLLNQVWQELKERRDLVVKYMPQDYWLGLHGWQTPIDYVQSLTPSQERGKVMTFLGSMRFLAEEMSRPLSDLSGGQRAKLLLMGLMYSQANFLLLDEPTRNLSPSSAARLTEELAKFTGGFLVVSHDRYFLEKTCEKIYELSPTGLKEVENLS